MRSYQWIIFSLGLWLIISPWVLGFSSFNLPMWNAVVVGIFVVIFSLRNISSPRL